MATQIAPYGDTDFSFHTAIWRYLCSSVYMRNLRLTVIIFSFPHMGMGGVAGGGQTTFALATR
jgi:hypothetical protein